MADARSGCRALQDFLLAQNNTESEISALGIQGAQAVTITFSLDTDARKGTIGKGGKKKASAAKGGKKKSAKGGKKTAKGGKKTR